MVGEAVFGCQSDYAMCRILSGIYNHLTNVNRFRRLGDNQTLVIIRRIHGNAFLPVSYVSQVEELNLARTGDPEYTIEIGDNALTCCIVNNIYKGQRFIAYTVDYPSGKIT